MPLWISTPDANWRVSFCNITPRETKFHIDSQKTQSEARTVGIREYIVKFARVRERASVDDPVGDPQIWIDIDRLGDPRYFVRFHFSSSIDDWLLRTELLILAH